MRVHSTDLQNSFGKYLAMVKGEEIIVLKNGKSVAKLIAYSEPSDFIVSEELMQYQAAASYKDYLALVESTDQRYELIDGEIHLLASPSYRHQVMVNEIGWHFNNYFRNKPCRSLAAPLDVHLHGSSTNFAEDPNVVQPDVLVICDQDKVRQDNKYHGTPTLIVEVLSPSTRGIDMIAKLGLYMKSGVREYWIIDLEERVIYQYHFTEKRELARLKTLRVEDTIVSAVFPELTVALSDLPWNSE